MACSGHSAGCYFARFDARKASVSNVRMANPLGDSHLLKQTIRDSKSILLYCPWIVKDYAPVGSRRVASKAQEADKPLSKHVAANDAEKSLQTLSAGEK